MIKMLIVALCVFSATQVFAAAIVVKGVQMPAWIERDGRQAPLKVGSILTKKDQLRTGMNARILLSMEDGSDVKLGENGTLRLDELSADKNLFSAALNVLKGAFRFSTNLTMKQSRRDVKVLIGTATIGIRGTDVWGKATEEKDIVCLLEGNISVNRGNDPVVLMQDPLTFYIAPKGEPAQPLAAVSMEQIGVWAKETDIQAGEGAARAGGKWKVYLYSTTSQNEVIQAYDTLGNAGYAGDISPVTLNGETNYRLRIANLPSKKEAGALAKRLEGQPGVGKIWISTK